MARGALFANSGSFKKAVDDFDNALKLNPGHANARRYKGETLVALGRSYEEENKIDDAMKAYQNCLTIIPRHEEAQKSLDFLRSKKAVATNSKQLIEPNELTLPGNFVFFVYNTLSVKGTGLVENQLKGFRSSRSIQIVERNCAIGES